MREFEKCSVCKKDTTIKKNEDVKKRKYYIEGAGQLCRECYNKIYGKPIN